MNASVSVQQLGAALQISVLAPMPVCVEFRGEALVQLLMAALQTFREQEKSPGCAKGGLATKRAMGSL